jgi:glutamate dehydrogenase/leucine dehydrogenase
MSSLLVAHAAEQLDADQNTFERMIHPDDVVPIPVNGRFTAFRSLDFIPDETHQTQGGFRIKRFDDSRLNGHTPIDFEADEREARELSADMTPKLGFILRCLRVGIERGEIDPAFSIPRTGGAKCVLSMPNSIYGDEGALNDHLNSLVDNYMPGFKAGDGFGPDMGVSPGMMQHMSHRAVGFENHFTNKPNAFPGRDSATGDLGISALHQTLLQKNVDIPYDRKTIVIQGLGSAGGWAEKRVQEEMVPDGYRVVAVADQNMGLVARDRNRGIKQDLDYAVDEKGRIYYQNLDTARYVPAKDILYQDAGVKVLAAIGGVITPRNWEVVTEGTVAIGEIANLGVDAEAALAIEREAPELTVVPVPLISAGGVIISLFERHRAKIEHELKRPVTAEDTKHIVSVLAMIGAVILIDDCERELVCDLSLSY